ncbi:[protein-PII] uridylyltransferase [Pseudahrensia aquimaris]|uniref:Bifunctional uridylyltransferase/uridylyl-removing enzyme n=1 Tax=Pseudahrensia aquimaris TaxID=744461 RepID=A0ABW3FLA4_9HYPH
MATIDPLQNHLIDADQLRRDLTALTEASGHDGSSSDVRREVLAHLKATSKSARAKAEALLIEDGQGWECAHRLSRAQDDLIRVIYDFAVTHVFRVPNLSEGERMAVTAVGGYGRGSLAPGSDIDLLFVLPYKKTALVESIVEYILYMLWDMGFKVGHATRSVDDCIRLSREDMTIRTSILEARFLWGHEPLFEELVERFDKDIVAKTAPEFIAAKLAERDSRHEKVGRSRYMVEPNIKDGKGGQRDLHTLFWIAKYYYRLPTQIELKKAQVFSKAEFRRFTKAQDFLWAVRCHLHFLTGRAEERISFDLQPDLAARLGYQDHPGMSAVERFMKHYFLVAKDVGDLTRILCSKLEDEQAKQASSFTGVWNTLTGKRRQKKIKGTDQFLVVNNRITPIDDKVFKRDPNQILKIFRLAEENGFLFHPDAMHLLSRSSRLITKALRNDPEANADFLAVLTSRQTPERVLRKMNETGVLGRFIPDFGKIVAMMQFNMYHHFTVDEHLLRSIGILSEIEKGELGEEHPLANEIMGTFDHRVELYVALLMHDIAKGRPEDHSIAGAKVARKLCPRLGLDAAQTEFVAWLVEQHLVMSYVSQSRDLGDPKTISDFTTTVQSLDRLKALLVLTVCDIKAVGPGVWNGWKGQLLRTLYYESEPRLTGGFTAAPRKQRVLEMREQLSARLTDWEEAERKRVIGLHYDNYLLNTPLEHQVRHANFIRENDLNGNFFAINTIPHEFEAMTAIDILTADHPNLLSIITGCCASIGANIVDAQIFTMRDGRALDTILLSRGFDDPNDEKRRGDRIGDLIRQVLTGEIYMPEVMKRPAPLRRRVQAFSVPVEVTLDNTLSNQFTVLEVVCRDRAGLLSDLTGEITAMSLDIKSAHIATFGARVTDTFYITDLVGQKIENPTRIKKIRERLTSMLDQTPAVSTKKPRKKAVA